MDADGDLDLYVTTVGDSRHYLYINQGGRFTEEALIRGVSLQFPNRRHLAGMTPSFGDFDLDGYLDIYVSEWIYHFYGEVKKLQYINKCLNIYNTNVLKILISLNIVLNTINHCF